MVVDYYLTPSAVLADYVFRAASTLERTELWLTPGFSVACLKGIGPLEERRDDYLSWRGLAVGLGQAEHRSVLPGGRRKRGCGMMRCGVARGNYGGSRSVILSMLSRAFSHFLYPRWPPEATDRPSAPNPPALTVPFVDFSCFVFIDILGSFVQIQLSAVSFQLSASPFGLAQTPVCGVCRHGPSARERP